MWHVIAAGKKRDIHKSHEYGKQGRRSHRRGRTDRRNRDGGGRRGKGDSGSSGSPQSPPSGKTESGSRKEKKLSLSVPKLKLQTPLLLSHTETQTVRPKRLSEKMQTTEFF